MNLLTKFHEDWTVNVASRANLLTKFHENWTINVASREKCPAPGGHVFKATITIFKLIQDIIGTNLLTKFYDDRKINVTSRPRPRGDHVYQPTGIIFELVQDIIGMILLTEFHEDRTINVASKVLTRFYYSLIQPFKEKCPAPWRPYIIGTNLLTKFHDDRKINVTSRVLTRKNAPPLVLTRINAPPPGGHVFKPTGIIFELVQDIIGMNLLTKKNAPPLGSHVFQAKVTIFEHIQDIIGTNLLSKFHEDWKINTASRVLTRFYYSHIWKNAPPPGGHVFQPTSIIFELVQDIIGMNLLTKKNAPTLGSHVFQANVTIIENNLLTKFHEDWTINVASRELTSQMLTSHNARRTMDKRRSQKLTMNTLCSGELKITVTNIDIFHCFTVK
ncbi:hypothetical protein DPMN_095631 [Dreissena polymorpha]|uniref:Uncharacterized protein n=1 Tax=Dreissena polymorpha TaxID=45954 RepID=A0A9D4R3R4_DREPO|nr:hypothetical protein DPMN_095631 [Dreissena polymorpha]